MGRRAKAKSKKAKDPRQTPVMKQFFAAKRAHPDAILFFRMGDFYEMFFEDAVKAAALLDLTLTSRNKSRLKEGEEEVPMAGVPHHAAAGYIARLLEKGHRVALCEQLADPSTVKGLVPRGVVRVITPGLALDPDSLDARADNFLVCVTVDPTGSGQEGRFGLSALELTRSDLRAAEIDGEGALLSELSRLDPKELLLRGDAVSLSGLRAALEVALPRASTRHLEVDLEVDPEPASIAEFLGEEEAKRAEHEVGPLGQLAARALLAYAQEAQQDKPLGVHRLVRYDPREHLILDEAAVRNLELVRTLSGDRKGSLLHLLDATRTSMGARLLRRQILSPLTDLATIRRRHDAVEALLVDAPLRDSLQDHLRRVGDMERLATRVELLIASPRDLGAVREGLRAAEALFAELSAHAERTADRTLLSLLPEDRAAEVRGWLETALVDEPPVPHTQGGIFREKISAELDESRLLSTSSKDVLLSLEARERESTGIGSLKVRYTRVFGYYIEVTRANLHLVPEHYRRKQTVANGERYLTDELEVLQSKILRADERIRAIEGALFVDLRERVAAQATRLRELARALAELDAHASWAELSHRHDYVRPSLDESVELELKESRHPVVERLAAAGTFVPNDLSLSADGERLILLTGPNMAGKSTAMRQLALAVIMAQAGGFVAAREARVGLVDRVFTRVGASDDLSRGQSTFMVEMKEAAVILREASRRSLVVLDEIGRGTSTYDGLAIAWAIAEHLHDGIGCRSIFATHYHELCELAELREGVANYNVSAREHGDDVVFLHTLARGSANRSYGIAVARLAGVHELVLARAKAILAELESEGALTKKAHGVAGASKSPQLDLFAPAAPPKPSEVEATLRELDLDRLRPIDALMALVRLKGMLDPTPTDAASADTSPAGD